MEVWNFELTCCQGDCGVWWWAHPLLLWSCHVWGPGGGSWSTGDGSSCRTGGGLRLWVETASNLHHELWYKKWVYHLLLWSMLLCLCVLFHNKVIFPYLITLSLSWVALFSLLEQKNCNWNWNLETLSLYLCCNNKASWGRSWGVIFIGFWPQMRLGDREIEREIGGERGRGP